MGWLGRLLGAVPKEEQEGICLDTTGRFWEVDGPRTFVELFDALQGWLPEDAVLYFEGGWPDQGIDEFMEAWGVPEVSHVAMGTIWPRPRVCHVPATQSALAGLARLMQDHSEPELASHFHVYRQGAVLLQWHDVFSLPILISGEIAEDQVRVLAERIGQDYRAVAEGEPGCSGPG